MTHIKRDGQIFCLTDKELWLKKILSKKYNSYISFTDAVKRTNMNNICGECQQKFYKKLNNLKNPIQL
jgi:hypothetical protein